MAEVLVRHCTIRVVRRGGWSWGPQPRALLDRILRQVPSLIALQLDELFPDDGADREITAPVRLSIPLSLPMLCDLDEASATMPARPSATNGFAARVTAALSEALASQASPVGPPPSESRLTATVASGAIAGALPTRQPDPLSVLIGWARDAQLEERLRGFSVASLRGWHDWIANSQPSPEKTETIAGDAIEPLLGRLAAHWTEPANDEAEALRRRLTLFIAVEAAVPGALRSALVHSAIERILFSRDPSRLAFVSGTVPFAGGIGPDRAGVGHGPPERASVGRVSLVASAPLPALQSDAHLDMQIESALPFLLLGPLARIGYLDTIAAVLQAANASEDLPLFAVSLAYKVLAPPARGWLRAPSTVAAAAAFGLLPEAPPDAMLTAAARRASDQVSPLDAVVATTLIDGHRAGTPFLLTAADARRLALFDVDGAFPIASAPAVGPLLSHLRRLLHEVVLVPAAAASPEVLVALDAAQVRFVTDAPPSRNESWRAVRGRPGEVWWSNDTLAADERLAAVARRLVPAAEDADEFWKAIGVERPSVPRAANETFDSALTLAAGLALGGIAWELWREREVTSPQLALARFHDLDARLRVDAESVRVSLSLGRRFRDLYDHGFLDDVNSVPWFGGRVLRFASG